MSAGRAVNVGFWCGSKGHRIRAGIQPYDGQGHGTHHAYDPSYRTGATNVLPTGPEHIGYVQLPIVPS